MSRTAIESGSARWRYSASTSSLNEAAEYLGQHWHHQTPYAARGISGAGPVTSESIESAEEKSRP